MREGSLYISGKLPPTPLLRQHFALGVGLREGFVGSFPETYKKLYFRMGAHKAPQAFITEESQGKAFLVERVILHEKYDPVSSTHDIALIKLDSNARIRG